MAITISGSGITSANIADGTITTDDILASDVKNLKSGRKNLIINGDMRVSQRGDYTTASGAANGGISLDRWEHHLGSVTANVQDTVKKQKIIATSTNASAYLIQQQIVEFHTDYAGKTVTASAKVTSNNTNARLAIHDGVSHFSSTAHSGNGAEELLTVTATLGASPTTLKIRPIIASATSGSVSITSGDYIEFGDVQLELGSVATDFEHRSYGEELALCQRYYWQMQDDSNTAQFIMTGLNSSSTQVNFYPPVPFRVRPTIGVTDTTPYWESYPWNTVGTTMTISAISNGHFNKYGGEFGIFATFNPAPTRGTNYNVNAEVFTFDAEL